MSTENRYLATNKASWNQRVDTHLHSEFYDLKGFMEGGSSLNGIELDLLGAVKGQSILHLQCHFGQDTISLARMGADVTGVDLSDRAIETAERLALETGTKARFLCCNLYDLPEHLDEQFDLVFTSYGTITWLPDLDRWAALISRYLKPGGRFVFAEFHPVVWMFDDAFEKVAYRYFNSGPIIETVQGTYADRKADLSLEYVCWNHGLEEVLTSLLQRGLHLRQFREFDYSPYNCFAGTVKVEEKKYRIAHLEDRIPMVYALEAVKGK